MTRIVAAWLVALWVVGPSAARAAGPTDPPRGALSALTGPGACFGPGCARLRGPRGSLRIAISPDARNVYVAGEAGGLAVLARDRRSGRLRQLRGRAGCVRADRRDGCAVVPGLDGPGATLGSHLHGPGAIVSPDGRSVDVTTAHGIVAFTRDRATGTVHRVAGAHGCVDAIRRGCARLRGMTAPTALLAAGNGTVYVAGTVPDGRFQTGALVALARNRATGRLGELPGTGGCLNGVGSQGCAQVPCLSTETALALSRDGSRVYAGSTGSLDIESTGAGMVSTFGRSVSGALAFIGCVQRSEAISDLVTEPTGSSVLVSTVLGNRGTGASAASVDLYLPGAGGQLMPDRELVCAGAGCPIPFGPAPSRLAITRDGATAYYAVSFSGIVALRVRPDSLVPLGGRGGCVVSKFQFVPPGCIRNGRQVGPDEAVSPDGRNLYVGTLGPGTSGVPFGGGLETFKLRS